MKKTEKKPDDIYETAVEGEKVESEGLKSGLTWRSFLALLYSLCVFTPAVIWLQLVTLGVGLGAAIPYCTLLLFAELARISGKPLTKQEATIIFGPATAAGSAGFLSVIYSAWFVKQPMLNLFSINALDIPTWWAPPATSKAFELRTLANPYFLAPILLNSITWFLSFCHGLFFALFLREVYIEGERLPFPIQHITVEAIESLTERTKERIDVIAVSGVIALIYATILYVVPTVSTAAGYPIKTIPIPWVDFTQEIEKYFPGAAIGIVTDILVFAQGFVLPINVVLGMLIGSAARFVLINPLLVKFGWTEWAIRYTPGMDTTKIFQFSTLYFWLNPLIGIGFAVGIIPLLWRAKTFASAMRGFFKGISKTETSARTSGSPFSPLILAALFFSGCVAALILDQMLAPGFPVLILAFYQIVLPFIVGLASGRMIGITGQEVEFPHLYELTILGGVTIGYTKIDAWFLPLSLNPGTGWMANMKICQLTGTTIKSWIIAAAIAYPISLATGFLYMSLFWQLSPIPSAMYPTPAITWPVMQMQKLVWITRPEGFFDVYTIIYSFFIFGALIFIIQFVRLPSSMVSVAAGLSLPIPMTITISIGLVVGKVIIAGLLGKEKYEKYRTTLAAGVGLGEGLAIVIGVTMALVVKSIFAKPY